MPLTWLGEARYDLVAKTDRSRQLSEKELEPLLRALLANRFRLVVHRVTKELSVYSLVPGKNGPKLTSHAGPVVSSVSTSYESGIVTMNAIWDFDDRPCRSPWPPAIVPHRYRQYRVLRSIRLQVGMGCAAND